jgi:2-hydroxyacyl-CoA lyase 1
VFLAQVHNVNKAGHTNAISGLANAWSNSWPMLLISGASDLNQTSRQAFQECEQEAVAKPYCKYTVRINDAASIPFLVEKAIRKSITGRPGPVYLELPGDVLKFTVPDGEIKWCNFPIEVPIFIPRESDISKALTLLKTAKNPLVIIGKGAAYASQ